MANKEDIEKVELFFKELDKWNHKIEAMLVESANTTSNANGQMIRLLLLKRFTDHIVEEFKKQGEEDYNMANELVDDYIKKMVTFRTLKVKGKENLDKLMREKGY